MEQTENAQAQMSPFSGSENGVAPRSDPSAVADPEKRNCDWLANYQGGWQYGEQGVLDAIIDAINGDIPDEHRWCVEFGAGNGAELPLTCDRLLRRPGWRSLLIDGDPENCQRLRRRVPGTAMVVEGMVTPEAGKAPDGRPIDQYMEQAGCPTSPALMVVDVDSIDFYIVKAMRARPYVLCVEHMDMACPQFNDTPFVPVFENAGQRFTVPTRGGVFALQANAMAMDMMVPPLGYALVYRTRVNSVYVRADMIDKVARFPDGKVRLNIGAGDHSDRRYTNIDIKNGGDARALPYDDCSVDEVYSSHLLEHFGPKDVEAVLAEWARVLKPGGLMRIAVPDIHKLAKKALTIDEDGGYRMLEMMVCGAHSEPNDKHASMFTRANLAERMHHAGIGFIKPFEAFVVDDCSNYDISLNLEGIKRWFPKIEKPSIALVLNQPRFTFSGHEISLLELSRKLDFNIQTCAGSFWDRDMTTATQAAIQTYDPDLLFYSDYDSVFEVEDVRKLIETILNDPTMAAIGAVQMSRHNDRPLVFEDDVDYTGAQTRVNFSHFGAMIIRREVFDELPKPWFWSIPGKNANGEWDWDTWSRTDADITFWRNLKRLGFRVYQHNEVCIGHIVQAVKYPRNKGRGVQLIPMENYWKTGKPADAIFNAELYKPKPALSPPGVGGDKPPASSTEGATP